MAIRVALEQPYQIFVMLLQLLVAQVVALEVLALVLGMEMVGLVL